jgi:serine protease
MRQTARLLFLNCLFLTLAACGGGGGGGGGSSTAASAASSSSASGFTLSGTISLPDTAAVDNDTNDPNQAGWISNDTAATAQAIATPIQLLGSLNTAYTGSSGKTYTNGDELDVFQSSLSAGQVIELFFAPGTSSTDIDLALYDASTLQLVGYSISSSSTRECISVSRSGNYYVVPFVYTGTYPSYSIKGAALYSMRIGAPDEGTSCSNTSSNTEMLVAGQIVAKPRSKETGLLAAFSSMLSGKPAQAERKPELLEVPAHAMRPHRRGIELLDASASDRKISRALGTLRHIKTLQRSGDYEYVEPNYRLEMLASYTPNDPSYLPQRWHYEQINLPSAMDRILALSTTPSVRPIVAVIDTGIVSDHPDLQAQIAGGYSFISSSSYGDGNSSSYDDPSTQTYCQSATCWHGSHVAGTVAAISDNSLYGAGVAKMAQLMPLRVFQSGSATSYDVSQAILYAARLSNNSGTLPSRRADVINMSLGSSGSCPSAFSDAITQARAQGVVVVAAAGNSATSVGAPANCSGVISVGALDALKQKTSYSNYGANLSLAAPGGDLTQSTTGTGYPDGIYSTLAAWSGTTRVASFGAMTGTSMASPHVAGVIALMRYVNPAITPEEIDTLLVQGKLTDDINTSGRDDATGYGLINARKAVDEALTLASSGSALAGVVVASPTSLSFGSVLSSASLSLSVTAATTETVSSIVSSSSAISISAGSDVSATTKLGTYTITVDRSQLSAGTYYPYLTITTSASRTITVQLTVVKLASGSNAAASFGSVWVQASNASSGAILARQRFNVSAGVYLWSLSGIPAGNINLLASTDLNNNGTLCESGEACGNYPGSAQSLEVRASTSGLNFSLAPTLGTQ